MIESDISAAKQRVLDTAETLFMERGYAAVTLRDIADALGVRQASLYHHFPEGKEQLYVAVIEQVFARHRAGMEDAIGQAPANLRCQLAAVAEWLATQPAVNFLGMMYADLPALGTAKAQAVSQIVYEAMFGPLRAVFASAAVRGESRPVNPELMAGFFLALMDGITFSLTQQRHFERAALVGEALSLMVDGLAPRRP